MLFFTSNINSAAYKKLIGFHTQAGLLGHPSYILELITVI